MRGRRVAPGEVEQLVYAAPEVLDGGGVTPQSDVPADTSDFEDSEPAAVGSSDDDIPF